MDKCKTCGSLLGDNGNAMYQAQMVYYHRCYVEGCNMLIWSPGMKPPNKCNCGAFVCDRHYKSLEYILNHNDILPQPLSRTKSIYQIKP